MPRAYSLDRCERVGRFVEHGHSRHAMAVHLEAPVSIVANLMKVYLVNGSLEPDAGGGRRRAELEAQGASRSARVEEKPDIAMPEPAAQLPIGPRCRVGSFAPTIVSKKLCRPASRSSRGARHGMRFSRPSRRRRLIFSPTSTAAPTPSHTVVG
jgi:hypothetical protein